MTRHLSLIVGTFLTALLYTDVAYAQCRSWFVARHTAAIGVQSRTIARGASDTVALDGAPYVSVLLAVAEGQSGDVVQRARGGHIVSRCTGDTLVVSLLRDGALRELMRQPLVVLRARRVVVNVTGGDGRAARWRVDAWESAAPDSAPVVDMFHGAIPLAPADHAITTVVEARPVTSAPASRVTARVPLDTRSGYPIASVRLDRERRAVVDLAAATTIVARSALPPGVVPRAVTMRQQSADGVQLLPLAGDGAGGAVRGFMAATLPTLALGDATLHDVEVLVLDALPNVGGAPIDLIVGLDLLRRAVRLSVARIDSVHAVLYLGAAPPMPRAPDITTPIRTVGALLGIDAHLSSTPLFLVLDSGAPFTVLATATARAAGLTLTPSPGPAPRGLDGAPLTMFDATIGALRVGPASASRTVSLPVSRVRVADLPVLARIRGAGVGLLGFDALRALSRVEVDFTGETLRIWR